MTDFITFSDNLRDAVAKQFHIGFDLASGDDKTCITVMQKMADGRLKLVSKFLEKAREDHAAWATYIILKSFLRPAKNRSERTAKKMIKKRYGSIEFFYGS